MSFDWNKDQSQERAPLIPEGKHWLKIKNVLHGKKNGEMFTTKNGDPKLLLILVDAHGNEGSDMIPLSRAAAFKLKQLLVACHDPFDFDKMNENNVTPSSFADPKFASLNLVGRHVWAHVDHTTAQNGKSYLNLEYTPDDAIEKIVEVKDPAKAAAAPTNTGGVDVDDIPF